MKPEDWLQRQINKERDQEAEFKRLREEQERRRQEEEARRKEREGPRGE